VLDWLGATGATKIAIHFDVDTIDADEIQLGLGADRGGLTSAQARRVIDDLSGAADVVALTIAEFIPRQVMHVRKLLADFPSSRDLGPTPWAGGLPLDRRIKVRTAGDWVRPWTRSCGNPEFRGTEPRRHQTVRPPGRPSVGSSTRRSPGCGTVTGGSSGATLSQQS